MVRERQEEPGPLLGERARRGKASREVRLGAERDPNGPVVFD